MLTYLTFYMYFMQSTIIKGTDPLVIDFSTIKPDNYLESLRDALALNDKQYQLILCGIEEDADLSKLYRKLKNNKNLKALFMSGGYYEGCQKEIKQFSSNLEIDQNYSGLQALDLSTLDLCVHANPQAIQHAFEFIKDTIITKQLNYLKLHSYDFLMLLKTLKQNYQEKDLVKHMDIKHLEITGGSTLGPHVVKALAPFARFQLDKLTLRQVGQIPEINELKNVLIGQMQKLSLNIYEDTAYGQKHVIINPNGEVVLNTLLKDTLGNDSNNSDCQL